MSPNGEAALDRGGWTASASSTEGGGNPANALDGNAGTRRSSGQGQASGQWFKLDMGSQRAFDEISLDAGSSTGDYPSNFKLDAPNDNANWSPIHNTISS